MSLAMVVGFISNKGDVVPCCVIGNPDVLCYGNLLKGDLRTI